MLTHGTSALFILTTILSSTAGASWIPDVFSNFNQVQSLEKRCENPCGYYGQLCCPAGTTCYTDASNQAQCAAAVAGGGNGGNGQWMYYTTTYVQTDLRTVTTTFSSYVPAATTQAPSNSLQCTYSQGETPCGNVCCHSGQYCQASGVCMQVPGGSSGYYSGMYTTVVVITQTAGPGIRPTSGTTYTLTTTGVVTGTTAFQSPVGTGGAVLTGSTQSSSGLSGGAIAGIVIGVIAGIILLLLICICCCCKTLLDGLLGIFGLGGRRRRTEETIIEERHSHHHHGGAAAATTGRRWFGQRPARTEVVEEKKKKSGFGNKLAVGAILASAGVLLGLRKKEKEDRTEISSSYYSYYDYSSDSSPSSVTRSRSRSRSRYSRR